MFQIHLYNICDVSSVVCVVLKHYHRCKGTMSYSHPDCVMKWINHSNKTKCEICKTKYNLKKVGYRPMNEVCLIGYLN